MDILYYLVSFFVIINTVVFVHEYGHYLAAKTVGVKVTKFSLGIGPELWGVDDKHGTRWCISAFPVGGYVMMLGDGDMASATENGAALQTLSEEEKKFSFSAKNNWEKMLVAFCGPFFNYIYAFLVIVIMSWCYGFPNYPSVVGKVSTNSAAKKHGIVAGDKIISVDGRGVSRYRDVDVAIANNKSGRVDFVIERKGRRVAISVVPEVQETKKLLGGVRKSKLVGISVGKPTFEKRSLFESVQFSFRSCYRATMEFCKILSKLFSGKKSLDDFSGVVQMASMAGDLTKSGNYALLIIFTAMLSLNLGFINLFPLPVLDGGRILICFVEEVIRKKLNKTLQERIMMVCAVLLILLMLVTTVNDILRIEAVNKFVSSLME
ncbi:MAG: RIP metalloprotease RseP [Holosporaceae bacterium]|jgi:regulator of sigma E protease|nr:RIP metalloprotease RseP [Holosporaceae bacterium]